MNTIRRQHAPPRSEQGLSMMTTVLMSALLLTGSTGLVIRQLMSRKLAAAESYQQMAENSALNGFNRILAALNKDDQSQYRGYLYTLSNNETEGWKWEKANTSDISLQELCTDTSIGLLTNNKSTIWPRETIAITDGQNQRNDGLGEIQLFYRLRGFSSPGADGSGEGIFEIEGLVKRANDIDDQYLARTLLTRSLYIRSRVVAEDDWGVIGAHHLELGQSKIQSNNGNIPIGKIIIDVNNANQFKSLGSCNIQNLAKQVGSTNDEIGKRVWPTLQRGLPLSSLFEVDKTQDRVNSRGQSKRRIWSFNDSEYWDPSLPWNQRIEAWHFSRQCPAKVCYRLEGSNTFIPMQSRGDQIILRRKDICPDINTANNPALECHLFVDHLHLSKTKVLIETGEPLDPTSDNYKDAAGYTVLKRKVQPVVIQLTKTSGSSFSNVIHLSKKAKLCGIDDNQINCNGRPHRLVISAATGHTGMACNSSGPAVELEGNALPHAILHLPKGTVRTVGNTPVQLHGLIWAHSICAAENPIYLTTSSTSGSVVRLADSLWRWSEKGFPGFGRTVTRGVRGTGLDTFRRW